MAGPVRGLRHLLDADWSTWRAKDNMCMVCWQSFCTGSCIGHRWAHHPDDVTYLAMITDHQGSPVIRIDHIGALGMKWAGIQRVDSGTRKSIPLVPMPAGTVEQRTGTCSRNNPACNRPCARSSQYCSLSCKLHQEGGGSRRAQQAQALVEVARSYHLRHRRDRFCTVCRQAFCQQCCLDHHQRHHGAQENVVIAIVHLPDGRPAIELGRLPQEVTAGVQEVDLGARSFVLIRPSPGGAPPAPRICRNRRCTSGVVGNAFFCSLRCKHVA